MARAYTNGINTKHWRADRATLAAIPATSSNRKSTCDLCEEPTVLRYPYRDTRYICPACDDAVKEWQSVLDMADAECEIGYDPTCGMQPIDEWRRFFVFAVLNDRIWSGMPEDPCSAKLTADLDLEDTPITEWATNHPELYPILSEIRTKTVEYLEPDPRPKLDSKEYLRWCERRWHRLRDAAYKRRGDVTPGRYLKPHIIKLEAA